MRILGFSKKWDKLLKDEFTTFRFTRRDKDWYKSEVVQVVFKARSEDREKLGIAVITQKEYRAIRDITGKEAVADGFDNVNKMWLFLGKPEGFELIHKLTLRWADEISKKT